MMSTIDPATIFKKRKNMDIDNDLCNDGKENVKVVVIHGDPTKPSDILPGGKWDDDDFETIDKLKEALNTLTRYGYSFSFLCAHDTLMDELRRLKQQGEVDIVLQFCDEGWQNHGRMELHICALLEMLDIPYSGSGPACIGNTLDKQLILQLAASIGVPTPRSLYIEDEKDGIDFQGLAYPVIVKPNSTDGSYGITKKNVCYSDEDVNIAIKSIREVFNIIGPILIQEYLEGTDANFGVIGNPPGSHTCLPITEEVYPELPEGWPKILGFESKWDPESPYWKMTSRFTTISKEKQKLITDCSLRLFHRLGVRDYARFDWRFGSDGNPRLLEVNPNCGWCWDGHLAVTSGKAGIPYPEMLKMIIEAAITRHKTKKKEPDLKYIDLALVRDL